MIFYFYIRSLDPAESCREYARYPFNKISQYIGYNFPRPALFCQPQSRMKYNTRRNSPIADNVVVILGLRGKSLGACPPQAEEREWASVLYSVLFLPWFMNLTVAKK